MSSSAAEQETVGRTTEDMKKKIEDLYSMVNSLMNQKEELEQQVEELLSEKEEVIIDDINMPRIIISGPTGRRLSADSRIQSNRPCILDNLTTVACHDPGRRMTLGFDRRYAALGYNPNRRSSLANIVAKDTSELFREQADKEWETRSQIRRNSERLAMLDTLTAKRRGSCI